MATPINRVHSGVCSRPAPHFSRLCQDTTLRLLDVSGYHTSLLVALPSQLGALNAALRGVDDQAVVDKANALISRSSASPFPSTPPSLSSLLSSASRPPAEQAPRVALEPSLPQPDAPASAPAELIRGILFTSASSPRASAPSCLPLQDGVGVCARRPVAPGVCPPPPLARALSGFSALGVPAPALVGVGSLSPLSPSKCSSRKGERVFARSK